VLLIDQDGHLLRDYDYSPVSNEAGQMEGIYQTHDEIDRALLNGGWPLVQSACLFRLSSVKTVNGYDERYRTNQDHDLFLKLAEIGSLYNLSEIMVKYRRHSGQVTKKTSGRDFQNILILRNIRRAAFLRRNLSLPDDLRIPAIFKLALKSNLSGMRVWPFIQKLRAAIR
jgi:hypothetical protein